MEWISVNDQLPEEYEYVLTAPAGAQPWEIKVDYMIKRSDRYSEEYVWTKQFIDEKVDYWHPIPKVPKK